MPRKPSASIDARITELHGKHRPTREIAAILGREGHEITASGVHRALARLGLVRASKGRKSPPAGQSADAAPPADVAGEPDDGVARLRRTLASLERAAAVAEADKDVARIVAAQKAITGALALLEKLTPAPPAPIDERPDMVAAAQRGRDRIMGIARRILAGDAQ